MRVLALAASALALTVGAASAADLRPAPAPTPAAVVAYNWTGFYIGAHGGGAWADTDWFFPFDLTRTGRSVSGGFVGGQIGYNWQFGNWVIGVEGEGAWADISQSTVCPNPLASCQTDVRWLASATGRLGYAWDNVLLYVKGGWAGAGERHFVRFPAAPILNEQSGNIDRSGWTVGGGVEFGFLQNWSLKIEYMYSDFGGKTFNFTDVNTGVFVEQARVDQILQTVKVGVNYRFNWGAPLAGTY